MREFLLKKYAHLATCYSSQEEFEKHFFGGEVTIPANDLLTLEIPIQNQIAIELNCNNVKQILFVKDKWKIKYHKGKTDAFETFDDLYMFLKTESN